MRIEVVQVQAFDNSRKSVQSESNELEFHLTHSGEVHKLKGNEVKDIKTKGSKTFEFPLTYLNIHSPFVYKLY